jgi:hypothetical protein
MTASRTDRWRFALLALVAVACHRRAPAEPDRGEDRDDQTEEHEEVEQHQLNFWRVKIEIVGRGMVYSVIGGLSCMSNGEHQGGSCGPKLLQFEELSPPLLHATAGPGWRFDHWESTIRSADGATRARPPPMPDGAYYLDGFGYSDTHETETVTAVFVPDVVHVDAP